MNRLPASTHSSRRGLIAIVVMVMLLVSMLILLAVVRAATLDARQFVMERRAMQADRLAEAGLARGLLSLSEETYDGEEWQPALPDGTTASVRISIEETDDTRRLLAVATWPAGSDRAVRSRRSTLLSQSTP